MQAMPHRQSCALQQTRLLKLRLSFDVNFLWSNNGAAVLNGSLLSRINIALQLRRIAPAIGMVKRAQEQQVNTRALPRSAFVYRWNCTKGKFHSDGRPT